MELEALDIFSKDETTESIPARFAKIAARFPNAIAISGAAGEDWNYAELDARSTTIAARILECADEDSESVAILIEHGPLLVAAILGVLKAGKIYLALDSSEPATRLNAMLNDSGARLILTDAKHSSLTDSLEIPQLHAIEIAGDATEFSIKTLPDVSPDSGAWLMYTSGSTGAPKGVWQNHRGVIHHAEVYRDLIQLTPEDRLSLLTSCSLAASATAIFSALLNGATLCPFHLRLQGVERLAAWMQEKKITVYHSVPTVFRHLARRASDQPGIFETVRLIRLGGEPVLREDVKIFQEIGAPESRLMHAFSSTETGLACALMMEKKTALRESRVSVGQPVRGVEILLTDENGAPVRAGEEGVISIRSANLSQGYWRQPEATARVFQAVECDPQIRIFRTGDRGRFLPDGSLEHLGRADQQVKIRGRRVDLSEVETALIATDFFEEAAAAALEDASGEQRLVAYVVPRKTGVTSQTYRRALLLFLPEHMLPSDFISMQKLPQTAGGKIDRAALPPPHVSKNGFSDDSVPRMGIEKNLSRIWESVLGIAPIGRNDDFFELGGTSLLSAEILIRVQERFGVSLPPSILVEHGTIEQMAELLGKKGVRSSSNPLIQLRASDTGRPLFLVHSGRGDVAAYGQLARRLPGRPIYGFQSVGLDGRSVPQISVRRMARRYLREILSVDPTGPYLLAGSCMGAMVAFEMAVRLTRRGKSVAFLGLFDFAPRPKKGPVARRFKAAANTARDVFRIARMLVRRKLGSETGDDLRQFIMDMNREASTRYQPGFFPGTITLFLSRDMRFPLGDRRLTLAKHARESRVITLPGDRAGIFVSPAVDEMAAH
ncbi:MAG TPA: AMP-binding protein, partial [Verrucomicrobiae bacterium]|nr:AMP-binding protein [Verrucomicrobiae bacterium]